MTGVVGPMFIERCGGCHNEDKQESALVLTTYAGVMRGGESGRVIVAGNTDLSDLLRRISLPGDDEEFMPAEGKTPLTAEQVEIIRWWITVGAPNGGTIGALGHDHGGAVKKTLGRIHCRRTGAHGRVSDWGGGGKLAWQLSSAPVDQARCRSRIHSYWSIDPRREVLRSTMCSPMNSLRPFARFCVLCGFGFYSQIRDLKFQISDRGIKSQTTKNAVTAQRTANKTQSSTVSSAVGRLS